MDSKQTLFNKALAHIRAQGKPSVVATYPKCDPDKGNGCMYRGADGLGCAAAPFILDYLPEMEGMGFHRLTLYYADKLDPIAVAQSTFVENALQDAHDSAVQMEGAFMKRFEANMARVASNEGLEYSPPTA